MANYDGDIQLRVDLTPGDITSTTDEMRKTIESIFKTTKGDKMTAPFKSLLATMDKAYNKSGKLRDRLKEIEGKIVINKEYAELEKRLEVVAAKAGTLKKQLEQTGRFSNERLRLTEDLKEANTEMHSLLSQMQEMRDNDKVYMNYTDTKEGAAEREKVLSELKAVNDQMTISAQRANEMQGGNLAWREFIQELMVTHPLLAIVANRLSNVAEKAGQAVGKLLNFVKTHFGIKALARYASNAAKSLANMAKNAAKAAGRGIINGFKRLASAIGKTNKASSNANGTFKKGFLFLLRYALGIRSIYFLFRRLRKALGEGFGNLAQYSSGFNSVVSDFISSLTRLKNTFATAFAPVVNVVLPIITAFINAMSDAVTSVGMFLAALFGQDTFVRAKKVQQDYAASLDNSANSANNATEAAKEYQRTISGFDDVEILKEPDKNGSNGNGSPGGTGNNGGLDPADMFETINLPAGFYDLAQMIKDAWATADFTDVGELLGQKLAEALNKIPWTAIQGYADKFGKSFATFINGLLSVTEFATAIGKTIGEAINTLFILANGFVSNLNWKQVGAFFAEVMNKGIATIQWDLIANTLATAANGIFNALGTWAEKFNFGALGTAISDTVKNILDGLKWGNITNAVSNMAKGLAEFINGAITPSTFDTIGSAIARALNAAIEGIKTFAITTKWDNLGDSIAAAIRGFASKFDIDKAGETAAALGAGLATFVNHAITNESFSNLASVLTGALNTAIKGIKTFLITTDWKNLGSSIGSAINTFFKDFDFKEAGLTLSTLGGALLDTAINAVEKIEWQQVGQSIVEFIAGIQWGDLLSKAVRLIGDLAGALLGFIEGIFSGIGDAIATFFGKPENQYGENIILGILGGIVDFIKGIGQWIIDNIFTPFGEGIGAAFGIASPAKEMKPYGKNIILGLLQGILDWIADNPLVNWLKEHILKPIKQGWEDLGGISGIIEAGVDIVVGVTKKAGAWVSDAWDAIKAGGTTAVTTISTAVKKASTWISDAWSAIKSGGTTAIATVSAAVKQATTWVSDAWSAIKSGGTTAVATISTVLQKSSTWVSDAWDAIKAGGTETIANVIAKISEWTDGIKPDTISRTIEGFQAKITGWIDSIKKKILGDGTNNGYTAKIDKATDNISKDTKQKTGLAGWWAKITGADSSKVPAKDKTIGVTAKATGLNQDSIKGKNTPTTTVNAKAATTLNQDNLKGKNTPTTSVNAKVTSYADADDNVKKKAPWKDAYVKISKYEDASDDVKKAAPWKDAYVKISKYEDSSDSVKKAAPWKSAQAKVIKYEDSDNVTKPWKKAQAKVTKYEDDSNVKKPWKNAQVKVTSWDYSQPTFKGTIKLTSFEMTSKMQEILYGAKGGVLFNGAWHNIAQYATGGAPTHGTMFVAGEAGAEAVGHIHGRTEVLNQSQMAAVMYSSVVAGVAPVINYMKECTNAIIRNIGSELNYLKFMSGQLYNINTLSNTLSTNVGNIVTGKVVPNNFNSTDMNNLNQTLDKLSSMLYDTRSNAVTREELTSILTTMFTRYMNFSCYIGDEDIARHANNGNARLEMRFSPVAR